MIRYVLVASVGAAIAVFFFSEKQPVYYDCLTDAGETFQLNPDISRGKGASGS
jgi:hypothetical protein